MRKSIWVKHQCFFFGENYLHTKFIVKKGEATTRIKLISVEFCEFMIEYLLKVSLIKMNVLSSSLIFPDTKKISPT